MEMSEPFLGEIRTVAFNFAPVGWFLCNGQTLAINQYTALFSLLGTTYGGNGTSTFQLPNLQGRIPIDVGTGVGLPTYEWGEMAGEASVILTQQQMPTHTHSATFTGTAPSGSGSLSVTMAGSSATGGTSSPTGNYVAGLPKGSTSGDLYVSNPASNTLGNLAGASGSVSGLPAPVGSVVLGLTGSSLPLSIEPPYLALYFIIAYEGIFPSRP
jgi:microcystin-dependent protein